MREVSSATHESRIDYSIDMVAVSKRFRRSTLRKGSYTTIKTALLNLLLGRSKAEGSFTQAISNFTARIPKGASLGIIGKNGSGKSTLLKLITGIYRADSGKISVNGRVAALIELGAGFHPDFTGRENLYLGGIMHGLSRAQIDERFDDIIKFAELENVIDDPVRTYSSGMYMRLGFSLAIHTDPDVLIVDEVLAVGDAAFVAKCKDKISELRKAGKTLLLVSHDLGAIERWCDEAIWLHQGKEMDRGNPRRVIDKYRSWIEKGEEEEVLEERTHDIESTGAANQVSEKQVAGRWGSREIEITGMRLLDKNGQEHGLFHTGDAATIVIDYKVNESTEDVVFGVGLNRADGLVILGTNTDIERINVPALQGTGQALFQIESLDLIEGSYSIDVAVHRQDGYPFDYHQGALKFLMRSAHKYVGVVAPKHAWKIAPQVLIKKVAS